MSDAHSVLSQDLTALEKQVLVERHLISREHAAKGVGSAVIMNRKQTLSIMINEEDHLRMQSIRSGLQLKQTFKLIDKVDSELEQKLDFAFHPQLGYLTACPTNVGTGMRASAMVHLPALVVSEQINQVIQAVNKIGLAVRGLYGEGTEALGNLFQVSNQTTLGEKEDEIISRLNKVIEQIIEHEQNARQTLLQKQPDHAAGSHRARLRHPAPRLLDELEGGARASLLHEARDRSRLLSRRNGACRSTSFSWRRSPRICKRAPRKSSPPKSATPCGPRSSGAKLVKFPTPETGVVSKPPPPSE